MAKWLVKSEPSTFSIDDLKRAGVSQWGDVRNYLARNHLRSMQVGDEVLFYHSSAEPAGVVGLAKVSKAAYPDPSQFDKKSDYFDPKATRENPRWFAPDLKFVRKFSKLIPISELRRLTGLEKLELLKRGSRLSVQPLTDREFAIIIGHTQ